MHYIFTWFEKQINPFKKTNQIYPTGKPIQILFYFISQAKLPFILLFIISFFNGLLDTLIFMSIGYFVDIISGNGFSVNNYKFILIVIILFLRPIFGILNALTSGQIIQANFPQIVRWQIFNRIANQSLNFFNKEFSGNLASQTWQSGQAATEFSLTFLRIIWTNIVFIISFATISSLLDIKLSLIILFWVSFFSFIAIKYVPQTINQARESSKAANDFNGKINDYFTNIKTMKLFTVSSDDNYLTIALTSFTNLSKIFLRTITKQRSILFVIDSLAISLIGIEVVLLWKQNNISLGNVTVLLGLTLKLEAQLKLLLNELSNLFRSYGTFQSSIKNTKEYNNVNDVFGAKPLKVENGMIEISNIYFGYNKNSHIINNLSLTIQPCEKVGIVGLSGAGKSTLVNLLLRFYDVNDGYIKIDNQDIRYITQDSLRKNIGLVTQEISLLHRSIYDNLTLGCHSIDKDLIFSAVRQAHAMEFIMNLCDSFGRHGFNAFVGDRGIQLSGGQRQRIAIARIIIKNPAILILDEATSALDSKLDSDIQETLSNFYNNKTVISIAHRLSTIKNMDRIAVINNGKIEEIGNHNYLMSKNGLYKTLWCKQFSKKTLSLSDTNIY